jgi:hypothetical protein
LYRTRKKALATASRSEGENMSLECKKPMHKRRRGMRELAGIWSINYD